jgi:hypothetical protein
MTQIIIGKSGYGKTTYAKKIANQNYIYLDIEKISGIGYSNFKDNSFYILEDLDTYESHRNIILIVKKLIKTLKKRLIITCHKEHHQKFKPILKLCKIHTLPKPSTKFILNLMPKNNLSLQQKKNIINSSDGDIQHSILQATLYTGKIDKKSIKSNIFDVVNIIMNNNLSLELKSELFFFDYNLSGLFFHENYISKLKYKKEKNNMNLISDYADDLSVVDLMETKINKDRNYSSLPIVADIYVGKLNAFSGISYLKFPKIFIKKKYERFDEINYWKNLN